jgi:hypothetical protein
MKSKPLPLKSLDIAGLRDFRVDAPRKPSIAERFGAAILHPTLIAYSRVAFTGMVGVIGLASIITMIGAFQ